MNQIKKYAALLLAFLLILNISPFFADNGLQESKKPDEISMEVKNDHGYPFSDDYPSLDELYSWYNQIEEENPEIVKKIHVGNSYEGRNIWAIKVSDDVEKDEEEPAVMIDGNIHAREWSGSQVASYYLWRVVNDYESNETIRWLVNNREIFVVPMTNPDGYYYDGNGDLDSPQMWRKNRNDSTQTDSVGVDLNRNWDIAWDEGVYDPRSNTYHGESPFSEPETDKLKDFILSKDIDAYQNLHSHYGTLLIPWAYTSENSPHDGWYRDMASDMTSMTSYLGDDEEKYSYGQPGNTIGYSAPGGAYDWVYEETGAISLCYEIYTGGSGFYPPTDDIMTINNDLYDSLVYQARIANTELGDGEDNLSPPSPYLISGNLLNDCTGEPVNGTEVTIRNKDTGEEISVTTDTNGYYEFNLARLTDNGYDIDDRFLIIAGDEEKGFEISDGWGKNIDMTVGKPYSIMVEPAEITLVAGKKQEFTVTALNRSGSEIEDVTHLVDWETNISDSDRDDNSITPRSVGEWELTANYRNYSATADITVEPAEVEDVQISAKNRTVTAGNELQFSAQAKDRFGNMITDEISRFTWENADEEGIFSKNQTGKWNVMASYEGHSETVEITVVPADVDSVELIYSGSKTITAEEEIQIDAVARDRYGNLITDKASDFTWENADETGSFGNKDPGKHEVYAFYNGVSSDPIAITVEGLTPDIEVKDFAVDRSEEGELMIDVNAVIENYGNATGELNLSSNGKKLDSWTLQENEKESIEGSYQLEKSGDFEVKLGEKSQSITLQKDEENQDEDSEKNDESTPGFTATMMIFGLAVSLVFYRKIHKKR